MVEDVDDCNVCRTHSLQDTKLTYFAFEPTESLTECFATRTVVTITTTQKHSVSERRGKNLSASDAQTCYSQFMQTKNDVETK